MGSKLVLKIVRAGAAVLAGLGALGFLAWLARFFGLVSGASKAPESLTLAYRFLVWAGGLQPYVYVAAIVVFGIVFAAVAWLIHASDFSKLEDMEHVHRWSVTIDTGRSLISMIDHGDRPSHLCFDVVLTNVSLTQRRVLDFALIFKLPDGEMTLRTESSRSLPYRAALLALPRAAARDRLIPMSVPVELGGGQHLEGRIEIDIPRHERDRILALEEPHTLYGDYEIEVVERRSDLRVRFKANEGWDGVKNAARPKRSYPQFY